MRRAAARAAATIGVALLAAGCGGDEAPSPGSTTGPATPPTPVPRGPSPSPAETPEHPTVPGEDPSTAPSARSPEVEAAVADLAEHLGLAPAKIDVVSYEDVTWPDGSIGCPQPGTSYTQALVPGSRLVLEAGGREYAYHAGREPELRRCGNPRPPLR